MQNRYFYFLLMLFSLHANAQDRLASDILALDGWHEASQNKKNLIMKKYFAGDHYLTAKVFLHDGTQVALVRMYTPFSVRQFNNQKLCLARGVDFFFPSIKTGDTITSSIKKLSGRDIFVDNVSNGEECKLKFERERYILVKNTPVPARLMDALNIIERDQLNKMCEIELDGIDDIEVREVEFYNSLLGVESGNITLNSKSGQTLGVEFLIESGEANASVCRLILD